MDEPLKAFGLAEEARYKQQQISYSLHRLSSKSKLIGREQLFESPGTRVEGCESPERPRGAVCIDKDVQQLYCGTGCTAL